jgi:hypothetical protein
MMQHNVSVICVVVNSDAFVHGWLSGSSNAVAKPGCDSDGAVYYAKFKETTASMTT